MAEFKFEQEITLDIFAKNNVVLNAKQGDGQAGFVRVHLAENGTVFKAESAWTASFRARKLDGHGVWNPATIEEDGTIRFELTRQTLACPGMTAADVNLQMGEASETTLTFFIDVEAAASGDNMTSKDEFRILNESIKKADAAMKAAMEIAEATDKSRQEADAAEEKRQENEAARQSAETAREEAEADRAQEHTAAMDGAAEATQQATDAAAMAKELAEHPDEPRNGTWWRWDLEQHAYVDTGQRAVLNYDVTYHSIAEMDDDADNQVPGTVAIISTDVNIEDNAKTYVKRQDGTWGFLADLSGFPGVGIESVTLTAGDHTPGTTDTYTIKLTDGREIEVPIYNGSDGEVSLDQLTAAVETAKSRSWEVAVPASGWGPSTETWGDLTAKYEATIEVPDMTEAPEIIKIDFAGGSRAAAGRWTWIKCTAGSVTLYSTHDPAPAADFVILVTEVR